MNAHDFFAKCGFSEGDLREATYETKNELTLFFSHIRPDDKDKIEAFRYLTKNNCYLAAQCCQSEETVNIVMQEIDMAINDEDSENAPWNIILAMYYLKKYEEAKQYIGTCLKKRDNKYVHEFYENILSIGFPHMEDQMYFLCHCYNGLYFFDTLSKLVNEYNWRCEINPDESYIDDLRDMLQKMFQLNEYKVLLDLFNVFGETKEEAKEIFLKYSGFDTMEIMRQNMHYRISTHTTLDEEQVLFEVALASKEEYTKIFNYVSKYSKNEKRTYSWLKFLLASYQYCENNRADIFECISKDSLFSVSDLYEKAGINYFYQIQNVIECVLKNPIEDISVLKTIERFNVYAECQSEETLNADFINKQKEYRKKEWKNGFFRSKIQNGLSGLSQLTYEEIVYIYRNTFLKFLFNYQDFASLSFWDEEIRQDVELYLRQQSIKGEDHKVNEDKSAVEQIVEGITLSYGEESMYSFTYNLDDEEYIAYKIPSGKYVATRLSSTQGAAFQIYRFLDTENKRVSEDDDQVKYVKRISEEIVISDDEYIVLHPESVYCFTLVE